MKENMKYLIDEYQLRESVLVRMLEIIHNQKSSKAKGIIFYGDSITEFCDLEKYYPSIPIKYNCGIHGITTTMLLHFIDEGVIRYHPSQVVILIGTNDLGNTEMHSPRVIAKNVKEMVEIIHGNLPECKIHLVSPLPCDENLHGYEHKESIRNNYMLYQIYLEYLKIIDYPYCDFIDVFSLIEEEDLVDGLHINENGYDKVTKKIGEYL